MIKLPGDEFVTLELVHDPGGGMVGPGGPNHVVIQVESVNKVVADLAAQGLRSGHPARQTAPKISAPPGLLTPMATESNWSSGPVGTPKA